MQDKDTEAINNQRKRRKRIGRIRNGIIMTIAGWIILSMILIIVLFVQVIKIQHKLDNIVTVSSKEQVQQENAQKPESAGESVYTDVTEATETPKTYESVTPPATGISEEENLAGDGDIHKVYLTFEDGPSDHTGEILDILAQYDVKATFLWSGKRMKNPRHCIGESQMRDIRSACILIPTNTARSISQMRHLKKILNAYVMNCIRSQE